MRKPSKNFVKVNTLGLEQKNLASLSVTQPKSKASQEPTQEEVKLVKERALECHTRDVSGDAQDALFFLSMAKQGRLKEIKESEFDYKAVFNDGQKPLSENFESIIDALKTDIVKELAENLKL